MHVQNISEIVATVCGVFLGLFALLKYFVSQNEKTVTSFLTYIETKNGNMERLGKTYTEQIQKSNDVSLKVASELARFSTVMEITLKK